MPISGSFVMPYLHHTPNATWEDHKTGFCNVTPKKQRSTVPAVPICQETDQMSDSWSIHLRQMEARAALEIDVSNRKNSEIAPL